MYGLLLNITNFENITKVSMLVIHGRNNFGLRTCVVLSFESPENFWAPKSYLNKHGPLILQGFHFKSCQIKKKKKH